MCQSSTASSQCSSPNCPPRPTSPRSTTTSSTSGFLTSYDKTGAPPNSDAEKNDPRGLSRILDSEVYLEILDAYSLLLFAIIGVDFRNYTQGFSRGRFGLARRLYDCSRLYLDYYQQLSTQFYDSGKILPFAAVPLKHFIGASSELFDRHSEPLLTAFADIQDRFVPRLKEYLRTQAAADFPLLRNSPVLKDLEMEASVLQQEAAGVLRANAVKDKTIKYDEGVRG